MSPRSRRSSTGRETPRRAETQLHRQHGLRSPHQKRGCARQEPRPASNGIRRDRSFAPRYDVLPTRLDPNLTDEHAYRIGQAGRTEEITAADLVDVPAQLGIRRRPAQKRVLTQVFVPLADRLSRDLDLLDRQGDKAFADLIAANMRALLPVLELDVPRQARMGCRDRPGRRMGELRRDTRPV